MTTVGRLKDGNMMITGELNERLPSITNGLVAHYPFDGIAQKYIPSHIRYVRDWANGSTSNLSNHWVEIQALTDDGINVALNKTATCSGSISNITFITDGSTVSASYAGTGGGVFYVIVDLEKAYNLSYITVWHYYADARTYHNTKTEVSEDGIHWYSIFDSAIEGEYVETSAGHTIDMENLGAVCGIIANNTTLTNDGIAVEEATTNMITSPKNSSVYALKSTYINLGTHIDGNMLFTNTDPTTQYYYIKTEFVSNGSPYTFSIRVKDINAGKISIRIYDLTAGAYLATNNDVSLSDDYQTISVTTNTSTSGNTLRTYIWFKPGSVAVEYLQLEAKLFATSFVDGSRSGTASVDIPYTFIPPFSINVFHKSSYPSSLNISQATSPGIFQLGTYYANASISLWNFSKSLKTYAKGDTGSGWSGVAIYSSLDASTWDNIENMYTIVMEDSTHIKTYMNGEYLGTLTSSVTISAISTLHFNNCGGTTPNAIYRDLSIYNRALSDSEVTKLYNNKLQIKSNGDLTSVIVKEKPVIPSDAYYFPLGFDGKDQYGLVSPTSDTNTVYSHEGVWVGSSATNLYTTAGNPAPWANNGGTITDVGNTPGEYGNTLYGAKTWKMAKTGTGNQWNGFQGAYDNVFSGVAGDFFTCQWKYKTDNSPITAFSNNSFVTTDWATYIGNQTDSYGLNIIADGCWHDAYSITQLTTAYTGALTTSAPAWSYSTSAGLIYIDGLMWEKKPFPSPFVDGTRGASSLTYNFNSSIGLDWNGDWSIVYWKKPIGTHNDTKTGYSLESLGCNSNSVGGGYTWWGKTASTNALRWNVVIGEDTTFTNYFNKLHMISLTKSGTTGTLKFWGIDGTIVTKTFPYGTIASNYYVTQYGYDFNLGGFDNAYPCNSYYKDLVVAKRALTDTELNNIYNTQMRSYNSNGKLLVRNGIIEVSSL